MKCLLTHCYSKQNRGDAAIVSTIISRVRENLPTAEISVVTMDNFASGENFEDAVQFHSFFYAAIYTSKSSVIRLLSTVYVVGVTLVWAVLMRLKISAYFILPRQVKQTAREYQSSDITIAVGGGYLLGKNNLHDTVTVLLQLHALLIAQILGKPVILFSQSIGPFGNFLQRWSARLVLNHAALILPREELSFEYLKQIGVHKPRVVLAADAAFLFHGGKAIVPVELLHESKHFVGITVRHWLREDQQQAFEEAIAKFVEWLLVKDYVPVFVPQVTSPFHNDDDMEVVRRIYKRLGSAADKVLILPSTLSFAEVYAAIRACSFVIGTRMHSVIFGLTSGVPAIAIAYERKTLGIMSSFNLQEYVIPMEQVSSELLEQKFAGLENNRAEYLTKLHQYMPLVRSRAEGAFQEVLSLIMKKGLS